MQKRSRRFGLVGIAALAVCLMAALFLVSGCAAETEETSEATLKPADSEPSEKVSVPTDPFYVLVVGNDSRIGTYEEDPNSDGRCFSDTVMLVRVDPKTYQITEVTIPRDTQITLDERKAKMNESYYWYGIDGLRDQVEQLTGVKADYYLNMGFTDFIAFIDDLGGLKVNVPALMWVKNVMDGEWITLEAGEQELDGQSSLVFARVRKAFLNGDASRQVDDRYIVETAIRKVASDPATVKDAVASLTENADTDFDPAVLEALVEDFAANADKITFYSGTGPYQPYSDVDDYGNALVLVPRDEETWARIMEVVNAGGDPTEVVPTPDMSTDPSYY